jgi:CDP-diacylglycerol--glycerol-3-phosphate 3-phosphatidyltransferase
VTGPTKPPRKPLITANSVTLARLVPMPLLAWWIYHGNIEIALVVGTIVACTDFVDGYLARKQGPTVFGGLLDPIADKVFVALIYLSFADLGVIPAWACALMFVREFLVTALRSAYERRGLSMKTSYLAKVKTWTQMQGIGVLMLFPMLDQDVVPWILWIGVAIPLVAMALLYVIKKKFWKGALVMSGSFLFLAAIQSRRDPELFGNAIMVMIVLLTWVSGVDYLIGAFKKLTNFARADFVRVVSAITLPVMIFLVARESAATPWPLLLILATELAVGGLDNLLSHHQKASGALVWGLRTGGVTLLLGGALLAGGEAAMPTHATWIVVFAAALSTTGVFWEFWRGRDYYLEARLRNQAPATTRAVLRTQSSG